MPKENNNPPTILFYDRSKDSRVAVRAVQGQQIAKIDFVETDDDSRFRLPCLMHRIFELYEGSDKIIEFLGRLRKPD